MCFVMGAFNTTETSMVADAKRAMVAAHVTNAHVRAMTPKNATKRDHVAVFSASRSWDAIRNDDVHYSVVNAREPSDRFNHPLFFHVMHTPLPTEDGEPSLAAGSAPPPKPSKKASLIPRPPSTPPPTELWFPSFNLLSRENAYAAAAVRQDQRTDVQKTLPASHPMVLCSLDMLVQLRRGQTQTDLVEGYRREYFSVVFFRFK